MQFNRWGEIKFLTRILSINTFNAFNNWLPSSIWGTLSSKSHRSSSVMRLSRVLSFTACANLLFWKVCISQNKLAITNSYIKRHQMIQILAPKKKYLHESVKHIFTRSWRGPSQIEVKGSCNLFRIIKK